MTPGSMRIAMWSGPRNISTAMMRAFGSRGDTYVTDEPLYAYYLRETGLDHPMAAEVIAHHEDDPVAVAQWLTGAIPDRRRVWYQKHMAHHLLPQLDRAWLTELTHAFLIRDPGEMIPSLTDKLGPPRLEDTGLPQQVEIFRQMRASSGQTPPVVDSRDVLEDPGRVLGLLCEALGLDFTDRMLSWEPGLRDTDGIWARHWYDAVERSTGFAPYRAKRAHIPVELATVHDSCQQLYGELYAHRIH